MSARKLQQEIERCFKQVDIGVEAFDSQYEKYEQSTNASQRDKLVDSIKKECKKLQRLRDQIKTWAAGSDVKDKTPLQDKRELIETKMEAFKAVEKEIKTKAFSKEGLLAGSRLDPKEKDKEEMREFLQDMIDSLARQVEEQEAETEMLQVQAKKAKKGDSGKAERVADLEQKTERHKWHQGRLELMRRHLENDAIDPDQVKATEDDIKNYVENNQEVDFFEDEGIYDDLGLDDEGHAYGVHPDMDRATSHDISTPEDTSEPVLSTDTTKAKPKAVPDTSTTTRRPSQHIKSPLPALASLHTLPTATATTVTPSMKPAPPPAKPPGEILKYASAAAAAAASDTTSIGIAPLPPPPSKPIPLPATTSSAASNSIVNSSVTTSPAAPAAQPNSTAPPLERNISSQGQVPSEKPTPTISTRSPVPSQPSAVSASPATSSIQPLASLTKEQLPPIPSQSTPVETVAISKQDPTSLDQNSTSESTTSHLEKETNGIDHKNQDVEDAESIYHLPASLQELLDAYESVKSNALPITNPEHQRMLSASYTSRPDTCDAEKPRHYNPVNPSLFTPIHYPQDAPPIFDDPHLYSKIDTDALFYSFYYRQGSYQQYLAAKALKGQSWRFHKQYQTWFQRHEEPKTITEDFEQGTYRFFDYESTWMNRRKANFEFAYKFLEDDL